MYEILKQSIIVFLSSAKSISENLKYYFSAIVAIIVTIITFSFFASITEGLSGTLQFSDAENVLIVSRRGSDIEATSIVSQAELDRLHIFVSSEIADIAIISAESYYPATFKLAESSSSLSLPIRGIGQASIDSRPDFALIAGVLPSTGGSELIVGATLASSLGINSGDLIDVNGSNWSVVGVFSTGGSLYESEVWSSMESIQSLSQRGQSYQSIRILVDQQSSKRTIEEIFEREPEFRTLDLSTVAEFYSRIVDPSSKFVNSIAIPIILFLGLGASIALYVSSSTSLKARIVDLSILYKLGVSRAAILLSLVIEIFCICVFSGVLGFIFAYELFDGVVASTAGLGLIVTVFELKTSIVQFAAIFVVILLVTILGAFFPAYRFLYTRNSQHRLS